LVEELVELGHEITRFERPKNTSGIIKPWHRSTTRISGGLKSSLERVNEFPAIIDIVIMAVSAQKSQALSFG
jgi:hypothetical protein